MKQPVFQPPTTDLANNHLHLFANLKNFDDASYQVNEKNYLDLDLSLDLVFRLTQVINLYLASVVLLREEMLMLYSLT